jgi:hypothetical protein
VLFDLWESRVTHLARENSGKELKELEEALCRNDAEGREPSLSRSRSREKDICTTLEVH